MMVAGSGNPLATALLEHMLDTAAAAAHLDIHGNKQAISSVQPHKTVRGREKMFVRKALNVRREEQRPEQILCLQLWVSFQGRAGECNPRSHRGGSVRSC